MDNAGNIVGAFEFVTNQTEIKNAARKANKVNEYQMATAKLLTNALEKISAGDLGYRVELPACDDDCRQGRMNPSKCSILASEPSRKNSAK